MISSEQIDFLLSRRTDVIGRGREKIGTLGRIYLDEGTGVPNFATVKTGLFGLKEHFFPLSDARATADGLEIHFTKDVVNGAPAIDPEGHLSEQDESKLFDYYSQPGLGAGSISNLPRNKVQDVLSVPSPSTQEEKLSPEYLGMGRSRLRKYVVSESAPRDAPKDHQREDKHMGRHAAGPPDGVSISAEGLPVDRVAPGPDTHPTKADPRSHP